MIKMKKNKKSLPRIQWKTAPLMGYYNKEVLRRKWNRDNQEITGV
jgi:hypothetical protein